MLISFRFLLASSFFLTALCNHALAAPNPDDQGCCVLYTPGISGGDATDNETRYDCAQAAKLAGVDYDFYVNRSCSDIKSRNRTH